MAREFRLQDLGGVPQPSPEDRLRVADNDVALLREGFLALYGEQAATGVDRLIRAVEKRCAERLRAATFAVHEEDGAWAAADFLDPYKED